MGTSYFLCTFVSILLLISTEEVILFIELNIRGKLETKTNKTIIQIIYKFVTTNNTGLELSIYVLLRLYKYNYILANTSLFSLS